MSTPISITGIGAVSPAGWGVDALLNAIKVNEPTKTVPLERASAGGKISTQVRRVPSEGANIPKAPRLRRASPISKFAAAAAVEALGEARLAEIAAGNLKVGVIFTMINGCVNYSNRFFGEVLADCSTASPILFPETVFNAPSSHLSAMIGSSAPNDTLIGDSAGFFTGLDLAIEWLERGEVDGCLVVCAEEIDWLSAEGLMYYSRNYVPSEGAAAVYLEKSFAGAQIVSLPEPISLAMHSRNEAAQLVRDTLNVADESSTLLVDGRSGSQRVDRPETETWRNWQGPRWSPRKLLGEGMGVSAGLQVVLAAAALRDGGPRRAIVTATGGNQQAAGVLLDH